MKWIGRIFVALGGLFVLLLVIAWVGREGGGGHNAGAMAPGASASAVLPADGVPPVEPVTVEVTAVDLFKGYTANEVKMDDLIAGRPLRVLGRVQSIEKDILDDVVVSLATGNQFLGARLSLIKGERAAAANLVRGQQVAVVCERMKFFGGMPMGSACRIGAADLVDAKTRHKP